jgi:maleylpyruvate isomerase
MKLFHYWRSSASWRVRYGLEVKGIQVEYIAVNLLAGDEKKESYLSLNPSGYLPSLKVEGSAPLGESLAILEWLEENYPSPSFFQGDSFDRARIRQLAESINSGIQPLQNLDVVKKFSGEKVEQDRWVIHWIERGLAVYENLLQAHGKASNFSYGDQPTLADLCLIPQCYSALRFQVNLEKYPLVNKIYTHALTTQACQRSHPEKFAPKG